MNKLEKNINRKNNELKGARGARLVEGLLGAQEGIIRKLKNDVYKLESLIENKLDLGVTYSTQLKLENIEDFDVFMQEINDNSVKLELAKQKLKIANEIKNEWLTDEVEQVIKVKSTRTKKVIIKDDTKEGDV